MELPQDANPFPSFNKKQPVKLVFPLATHDLKKFLLQPFGDRTALTATNRNTVNGTNGCITLSRVIPGRILAESGGVYATPLLIKNRFSPLPSDTKPYESSAIPSAYPLVMASILISWEFM